MADIELVIKIDENLYRKIQSGNYGVSISNVCAYAICNGTPLPKGHGAIVDLEQVIRVEIEETHTGKKLVWNNNPQINDTTWRMVAPAIIKADKG